jgi:hypothetical protein
MNGIDPLTTGEKKLKNAWRPAWRQSAEKGEFLRTRMN